MEIDHLLNGLCSFGGLRTLALYVLILSITGLLCWTVWQERERVRLKKRTAVMLLLMVVFSLFVQIRASPINEGLGSTTWPTISTAHELAEGGILEDVCSGRSIGYPFLISLTISSSARSRPRPTSRPTPHAGSPPFRCTSPTAPRGR